MDRLLTVTDVMERYQCSRPTARQYIRKMIHQEDPLTVREKDLVAWEQRRTVDPEAVKRMRMVERERRRKRA